jgi:hypothetical protein
MMRERGGGRKIAGRNKVREQANKRTSEEAKKLACARVQIKVL